MLKSTFFHLLNHFTEDTLLQKELWAEIERGYTSSKRHYHTLLHIENLLKQLNEVKTEIQDWNTLLFSLYYHDLVYNTLKSNNEAQSAALAEKRMAQLSIPAPSINACKNQILATKTHLLSSDPDTNYFTDADLSVLGQPWETYLEYAQNVRKEYAIYPDFVYNPGRKKVLAHFSEMDYIFKTAFFRAKFELQAKENLKRESDLF